LHCTKKVGATTLLEKNFPKKAVKKKSGTLLRKNEEKL
jgi:hypothetical protein